MSTAIIPFPTTTEKDLEEAFGELDGISGMLAISRDEEQIAFWHERLVFWQNEIRSLLDIPHRSAPTKFVF